MNFASDNGAGVAPEILEAIAASSRSTRLPMARTTSARARRQLERCVRDESRAFLVATGTAANALALSALARPWEAVFCHEEAHIHDDECGAPEFFTGGAKFVGVPGEGGKVTPEAFARRWRASRVGWSSRPSPARCRCRRRPRPGRSTASTRSRSFAASRAPPACGPTWTGRASPTRSRPAARRPRTSPGGPGSTRCRLARPRTARSPAKPSCSSILALAANFAYLRKRGGHTLSKGRLLGAQMEAYLKGDLWLSSRSAPTPRPGACRAALSRAGLRSPGRRSQRGLRCRARGGCRGLAGGRGEVLRMEHPLARAERAPQAGEMLVRLVTSFETEASEGERLAALAGAPAA